MKNLFKKLFFHEWKFFTALPAFMWQSVFLFFPLFLLFVASFVVFRYGMPVGITLHHYSSVVQATHLHVILRSLFLALLNACVCLVVAYPVAYFLSFRNNRFKSLSLFFLTLPFWINFLVHVYSWFFILDRQGLLNKILIKIGLIHDPIHILNTIGAVMLVMFHGYLPFMIMPIYTVLERLDKQLLEASMDLGATKLYTLVKIIIPLSFSGILAGFVLVFVLSFGDFVIPSLVGGGKMLFVGTIISDYFLSIRDFKQGAAFTFLSALFLIMALYGVYLFLRSLMNGNPENGSYDD